MGFTGLARWQNAPTTALELITENITRNHGGVYIGRWQLLVCSYRSTLASAAPGAPNMHISAERSMCTLTMNDSVFVLIEDAAAPGRDTDVPHAPHHRMTFVALRPPGALEHLLSQLRARWVPVRQGTNRATTAARSPGQQLVVDGAVFAIGRDWLVRAGNVILASGAVRGMLLEAEYLPIPILHSTTADGSSELLSNLLAAILPNVPDARTSAVVVTDAQWEEVLSDPEAEAVEREAQKETRDTTGDDDVFAYADDEDERVREKRSDWTGIERDRRSAFLIIGALKSEGIL